MKKQMLSAVATLSVALGALAQGSFVLDNTLLPSALAVGAPGNWYSGTFGMEVWELNGTSILSGVNLSDAPGSGMLGYNAMVAAGFVLEATYAGQTGFEGYFELGEVDMPDVSPAGATVVVALAAWNTSAPSWSAMLANANQSTRAGIVAFVQPTWNFTVRNGVPAYLTMSQDLVMTAVPEPGTFALAGLGWALLLLLRRRR
jgi:uncharacterized protein (TIGR03382 family)